MTEAALPEGWTTARVGDLGVWRGGGTPSKSQPDYWGGSIPWLTPKDFSASQIQDTEDHITEVGLTSRGLRLYQPSDVAVVFRSGILRHTFPITRCSVPYAVNQDIKVLSTDAAHCSDFVFYALQANTTNILRTAVKTGTTVQSVDGHSFARIEIALPPPAEQRKIAAVLRSVDEAVERTEAVIAALREVKRGMMQELLTKGIGHTEFVETDLGHLPSNWCVATLGELCDEVYRYPTYYNIDYVASGVPEVRGELIGEDGRLSNDFAEYRRISPQTSARFPRTVLQEGDFVLSVRGTMGKIGYVHGCLSGANMTANLIRLSPDRRRVDPLWLKHVMLGAEFQQRLQAASSATTIQTIQAPVLKEIPVRLPPLIEQHDIAARLEAAGTAVTVTQQELTGLQALKRGLMQQLLTGKVRVKV